MNEFEKEDEIVDIILNALDYDMYKEIIAKEQEENEPSYERILIRGALLNYHEWRVENGKQ